MRNFVVKHIMKGYFYVKDNKGRYLTESGTFQRKPLYLNVKFFSSRKEAELAMQ